MAHKKYTSKKLRLIAYAWVSFPVTYIVYGMVALGFNTEGILKLLLSPWYWLVSAMAVVSGLGVARLRWFAWYSFVFSNFLIAYQTAVALVYYSVSGIKLPMFAMTLFFQFVVTYLVGKEIRVPYFFPRIRWWESDPRYKLSVQAKMVRENKNELDGEIMDLSLGGCFVKTHSYFTPDELLVVHFQLFDSTVSCTGRVVWRTESTVTHPKGIGIKFEALNKDTSQCLRQATLKLKKLARVYTQMTREKNWQEYLQREQTYQGKKK